MRKSSPKIHIILPVHNRIHITRKFIECLTRQTYKNFHLILVDDGSTDGTAEYVKKNIGNLTTLYGNGKLWWAGALSKAYNYLSKIDAASDDLVWINNDDSIFDPDYFEKIINDSCLEPETLIISPGHSIYTDFIERGFSVDWSLVGFKKLKEGEPPDALTTRGLYMLYDTYISLGPMHPMLLPHYLSDLEYTIRAKRRGFRLVVSRSSHLYVDRSSTGLRKDDSNTTKEFLYNNLISKKTTYNTFYRGNFVLLAAPLKYKLKSFVTIYIRFLKDRFLPFYKLKSKNFLIKLLKRPDSKL